MSHWIKKISNAQQTILGWSALVAFSTLSFLVFFTPVQSATVTFNNYAWSENIGWIDFSAVTLNTTTGALTGYAWSENIGWIKFGGLSSFPAGSNGNATKSGNEVIGWARACAGTANGDCSTMTSRTDGWDGWISLNCLNTSSCGTSNYTVTFGSSAFSNPSYAWGGDVVGWIDMSGVTFTPPCAAAYSCNASHTQSTYTDQWCAATVTTCTSSQICSDATGTCVASTAPTSSGLNVPDTVSSGSTANVTWSVSGATSCTVTGSNGDSWTGTSGDKISSPITGQVTYTLTCISGGVPYTLDTEVVKIRPIFREI